MKQVLTKRVAFSKQREIFNVDFICPFCDKLVQFRLSDKYDGLRDFVVGCDTNQHFFIDYIENFVSFSYTRNFRVSRDTPLAKLAVRFK